MAQDFDGKPNGKPRPPVVLCPVCGKHLEFGLLEITEDDGEVVRLLTYDCPNGDFHGAMREKEFLELAAKEVVRRLRLSSSR